MIEFLGVQPNVEAEQSVIGAILLRADEIMPEAEEMLSEEDFLVSEYRTIYRTCSGYFMDGKPIDAVTLANQHGSEYQPILADCIQSMPSLMNMKTIKTREHITAAETARNAPSSIAICHAMSYTISMLIFR